MTIHADFDLYSIPEPNSGCWLWTASVNSAGYGQFKLGRRTLQAHRFAWERSNGPIPKGLCVLHKCDTPRCINPAHFFLGTRGENASDRCAKGRGAKGEGHGRAKLTDEIVSSIRRQFSEATAAGKFHWGSAELARRYGVSRRSVVRTIQRQSWGHVP